MTFKATAKRISKAETLDALLEIERTHDPAGLTSDENRRLVELLEARYAALGDLNTRHARQRMWREKMVQHAEAAKWRPRDG